MRLRDDPRGAARRAQMLRLRGVWTGYMAGAGRGRPAGLWSAPAFYIDLSEQSIGRRKIRSLRNAVSEFPQPIKRLASFAKASAMAAAAELPTLLAQLFLHT